MTNFCPKILNPLEILGYLDFWIFKIGQTVQKLFKFLKKKSKNWNSIEVKKENLSQVTQKAVHLKCLWRLSLPLLAWIHQNGTMPLKCILTSDRDALRHQIPCFQEVLHRDFLLPMSLPPESCSPVIHNTSTPIVHLLQSFWVHNSCSPAVHNSCNPTVHNSCNSTVYNS